MVKDIVDAIERAAGAAPDDARRRKLWRSIERIHPFVAIYETLAEEGLRANVHCVVTERCNYRCPFCQSHLSDASADPSLAEIRAAVDRLARVVPGARLTISGGEPTLRTDLVEIVSCMLERDPEATIVVQTNGALIGRRPERYAIAPSPRLKFLVALHALEEGLYDAVTATRGQLGAALDGLRTLLAAGHQVELNCVILSLNADHIVPYVAALPGVCGGHAAPILHLSVLGFTDSRDVSPYVVPYDRVVAIARDAVVAGGRSGVDVRVSLTARHSSVPVCMLDAAAVDRTEYPYMYQHDIQRFEDAEWWTKPEVCDDCRMEPYCRGLPKPYVAQVGTAGVRPIPGEGAASAPAPPERQE